jgi:LemA protein
MGMTVLIAFALVLIAVALLFYLVSMYNNLVRLKNDIDKAWSNIDVLLKERHDELPKLVDACKGYMQYEQKTLQLVTDARSAYQRASTVPEKAQADNMMTGALKSLFAVAENYPELKANSNFLQLQARITDLEERIADRREFFNDNVNVYNIRIQQFPDMVLASMMNLRPREVFKATEEDRRDVEVKFA